MASGQTSERSLADYLFVLRRYWVLIVVATAIAVVAGYSVYGVRTPAYTSSARVYVSASVARPSTADLTAGNVLAQSLVISLAQVATSPLVLNPVISNLKLNTDAGDLGSRMSVTVVPNTVVMEIAVTDGNPVTAARVANAIAAEIGKIGPTLNGGSSSGVSVAQVNVSLLQPAVAATSPVGAGPTTYVGVAVLISFVLLVLLIAAIESLRVERRLHRQSSSEDLTGYA